MNVLLSDDHTLVRVGLRALLQQAFPAVTLVETSDGAAAVAALSANRIDLAVVDMSMPVLTGIEVIRQARASAAETQFVMLTFQDDIRLAESAFEAGAAGFLLKEDSEAELIDCVRAVMAGDRYISQSLLNRSRVSPATDAIRDLTHTEVKVLELVGTFKTNREIAATLNIAYRTVQNHRANMVKKLGLSGANALLEFAARHSASVNE